MSANQKCTQSRGLESRTKLRMGGAGRAQGSAGLGCTYKLRRWVYLDDPNPPSPDKRHLIAFNSEAQRRPFAPPPALRGLREGAKDEGAERFACMMTYVCFTEMHILVMHKL